MAGREDKMLRELKEVIGSDVDIAIELVDAFNSYNGWFDDLIMYPFDEDFFEVYFGTNPMEAARATFFGHIDNWQDEYIGFNGYGNLISMSNYAYEREVMKYVDEIAEQVMENRHEGFISFPDEIQDIIDRYDAPGKAKARNLNRKPAKKKSFTKAPAKKTTVRRR